MKKRNTAREVRKAQTRSQHNIRSGEPSQDQGWDESSLPDWEAARPKPKEGELTRIAGLANNLRKTEWEIEQLEEKIAELNAIRDRIAMQDIPDLMAQFGLSEFKLADGSRVTVRPFISASIPTEGSIAKCRDPEEQTALTQRMKACFEYLRKNGATAIIKNLLKVEFPKGHEAQAREAVAALRKIGVPASIQPNVHHQTLCAWIRERLENGKPINMELFRVFNGNIAKVERPKQ